MMNKTIVSCIALFLFLCCGTFSGFAQREHRVDTPRFVLERMLNAWDDIEDYEAMLDLYELRPDGVWKQFWIHLRAVREDDPRSEVGGTLRMDVFDTELPLTPVSHEEIESATPIEFYFISPLGRFYTYSSLENSIVVDELDTRDPLPQFLQIAGFLNISLEELESRITLGPDVVETEVDGIPVQRITLLPREEISAVEPVRQIWIDPVTHLPVQFIVDGSLYIRLKIGKPNLNQELVDEDLTPVSGVDFPVGTTIIQK